MLRNYRRQRAARKRLQETISHARGVYNYRRDLMPPQTAAQLAAVLASAERDARRCSVDQAEAHQQLLLESVSDWLPRRRGAWAENFEVLLVAFGVAMAFRCYFFQPFKIPTGSMQPTLYGIHSIEREAPSWSDKMPIKPIKWLITGAWYREVRVTAGGKVGLLPHDDSKPGYTCLVVAGKRYFVPSDAVRSRPEELKIDSQGRVASGTRMWSGTVYAGDHVFVNRMAWNFRRPRRGEVMVFSTRDIHGLPQGTHYIKRMAGLPNDEIGIDPPNLLIDNQPVQEPYTIRRIAARERLAAWAPPYDGFQVIGNQPADHAVPLRTARDRIRLGPEEYYALGDNTGNSRDSRYWGPVPESNLLGPASIVYWPFLSPRRGLIH